jgi:hypothetical protein
MTHIDNLATQSVEIVMDKLGRATYIEDEDGLRFTLMAQDIYNEFFDMLETELVGFGLEVANEQKEICADNAVADCNVIKDSNTLSGEQIEVYVIKNSILQAPTVEFKEFDSLEDTDKYKYWQENHSDITWGEFNENYIKCDTCGYYDTEQCLCYAR